MMKHKVTFAGVLGSLLIGAACADVEKPTAPTAAPASPSAAAVSSRNQEKATLNELTRAVALALNDQGLRQRIKNDLRNSRHTHEHKLPFSDYLRGQSGGILLAKMAKETGKSRQDLLALLAAVRPLEFYMPVREHRESWTGGADLLVLGALDEADTSLVAFSPAGELVILSQSAPPSTPTLVLVQVETDFSKMLDTQKYKNTNDQGGASIGTFSINPDPCSDPSTEECPSDGGGGGGVWTKPANSVQRRGVSVEEFISHMRTLDDHEPWNLGAPEFYLLLAGKFSNGADFKNRINIPEGPWSGSDDDNNRKWRNFAAESGPISLMLWDTDLGTRVAVQCFEDDFDFKTNFTLTGSTEFPGTPLKLSFSVGFEIGSGDDNCGSSFINFQNSLGQFYFIPDGVDDDHINPTPPYFDGTSDLHWYGYGLQGL